MARRQMTPRERAIYEQQRRKAAYERRQKRSEFFGYAMRILIMALIAALLFGIVLAISISDKVGALHDVMALFQNNGINIEYLYASLEKTGDTAIIIFKVQDADKGLKVIEENGLSTVGKF